MAASDSASNVEDASYACFDYKCRPKFTSSTLLLAICSPETEPAKEIMRIEYPITAQPDLGPLGLATVETSQSMAPVINRAKPHFVRWLPRRHQVPSSLQCMPSPSVRRRPGPGT